MPHLCHATACPRPVPREMLMCRPHWFMVPVPLRRQVWLTYRPGQCDDMNPSRRYAEAARAAVVAVAQNEGREPDTRLYDIIIRRFDQAARREPVP